MLPQVNTIATTPTTILDIPSKTYKLNIDSEASAPYVIDNKNMVYFKLNDGRDDYITNYGLFGNATPISYNNLTITNNVKIRFEFELKVLSFELNVFRFIFTDIIGDTVDIQADSSKWTFRYQQDAVVDPVIYTYDIEKPQVGVRYIMDIYLANGKMIVKLQDKKIFEMPYTITSINPLAYLYIVVKYKIIYNLSIYNLDNHKYLLNAIPYNNTTDYGLYNIINQDFKISTGAVGVAQRGHLIAYPQNEATEVSFAITDNHLIGTSDNAEVLNKYYRLGHDVWFKTTAYSERTMGNIDGLKAVQQAVYKILMTERYAYLIYSNNYGVELEQYIGKDFNYLKATIEGTLKDALTYDLRIKDVEVTDISKEEDRALIKFNVYSIYGDLQMEVNISV